MQTVSEIQKIKAAIRKRDGYCCTECGMTRQEHYNTYGKDFDVHRINPGSEYSVAPGVAVTLCRACHGPKPKSPRYANPSGIVRIDAEVMRMVRIVAAFDGIPISQLLNDLLRPVVAQDLADRKLA